MQRKNYRFNVTHGTPKPREAPPCPSSSDCPGPHIWNPEAMSLNCRRPGGMLYLFRRTP